MTAALIALGVGVLGSLIAAEIGDWCPWLAGKLVRWAACRWTTDHDTAVAYTEEWTRIIEERPGKLLKLATALGFVGGAISRAVPRSHKAAADAGARRGLRATVALLLVPGWLVFRLPDKAIPVFYALGTVVLIVAALSGYGPSPILWIMAGLCLFSTLAMLLSVLGVRRFPSAEDIRRNFYSVRRRLIE